MATNLTRQAAYLYVFSKELAKIDHKLKDIRHDGEKLTRKYHSATDAGAKHKYQVKLEKLSHEHKKLVHERTKLLEKIHIHSAGFARTLQQEIHSVH